MVTVTESPPRLIDLYHLLSYDALDSTSAEARRLALGGGAEGAVIWAKKQTEGRGRMGRPWISNEGNLFVSVLLRPHMPQAALPQLSFVTALAVHDAILPMLETTPELSLKWPNDVLLKGKKVSGILLETVRGEAGEQWLIVGVGINVEHYPKEVLYPATCLTEHGIEIVSAKIVLSRFLSCFMERYDRWQQEGFAAMRREWEQQAYGLGKTVRVRAGEKEMQGVFEGIDENGYLLLASGDETVTVLAGDVFYEES